MYNQQITPIMAYIFIYICYVRYMYIFLRSGSQIELTLLEIGR